jgi:DNA-binding SARP family transcriptional activator
MPLLTIRLLGEFSVTDHRGNALSVGNKRTQALIAFLALRLNHRSTVEEMGELLFGAASPATIRGAIADLRYAFRFLPLDVLIDDGQSVRLNADEVVVDAQQFADLISAPSINTIRAATDIYRGNLLENFITGIPSIDEWIAARRLSYWRGAVAIFSRLLSAQIQAGWWEAAAETASRLLSLDPSQEVVHRTMMRLQLEQGRPDAALRRYHECADILLRDYDRPPSEETEKLRQEIMAALARTPAPREMQRKPFESPVLILLVEDDMVSAALMEGFLTEAGYEVVAVSDGADALIEIGRRAFELLLLDINVPTLNGLKLFEIMIQKGIETPAIFITGITGPEVEAQSLEIGAADFLRKPIRKEVLLPRIRRILERKQRAAASPSSQA